MTALVPVLAALPLTASAPLAKDWIHSNGAPQKYLGSFSLSLSPMVPFVYAEFLSTSVLMIMVTRTSFTLLLPYKVTSSSEYALLIAESALI